MKRKKVINIEKVKDFHIMWWFRNLFFQDMNNYEEKSEDKKKMYDNVRNGTRKDEGD